MRASTRGISDRMKKVSAYACVLVVVGLLPLWIHSVYYLNILILTFVYIMMTSSLRLTSLSGQISMGHAGFMGVGAYFSAVLSKATSISPFITIVVAVVLTFLLAFIVGLPFSRLRGVYFSMITLLFGMGLLAINQLLDVVTGGYGGLIGIPPLFKGTNRVPYYYFILGICALCLCIMYRMEFSRIGLRWKSISQAPAVAASTGVNESMERVLAFSIGSAFAGLAGALFAHYFGVLAQSNFTFLASMEVIVYMLTGGVAYFAGPIVGTGILVIIPELVRGIDRYRLYVFAGIMLIVLFVMPKGLAGLPEQILAVIRNRRSGSRLAEEEAV
jgi:branched-chain amino acid transport system permease protein